MINCNKLLNKNRNFFFFRYSLEKNILKNSFKLNFLNYFYFNFLSYFYYFKKSYKLNLINFLLFFNLNLFFFYRIGKKNKLIELNKFFFLKEFYKNFNFPWVYKNIFYYRLERNKRIRSSSYVPIELKRDGKTYCNDFDFNSWNMFNGDLIFFNTNFLFKRIFLFLKYFKSNSYLLDMRCNRILIKYLKNSLFKKKNWLNKIFIKKRYSIDLKKKKNIF